MVKYGTNIYIVYRLQELNQNKRYTNRLEGGMTDERQIRRKRYKMRTIKINEYIRGRWIDT